MIHLRQEIMSAPKISPWDDCPPDCVPPLTQTAACLFPSISNSLFFCTLNFHSSEKKGKYVKEGTQHLLRGDCILTRKGFGIYQMLISIRGTGKKFSLAGDMYFHVEEFFFPSNQKIIPFAAGLTDAFNDNIRRLYFPVLFTIQSS